MQDIYNRTYYRMFNSSRKVDNKLEDFALITFYDSELKSYTQKEVILENATLAGLLESKTPDMVSVVVYSRGIGLVDDIEVYGQPENVGSTIYFGTLMTVKEYNDESLEPLSLPLDKLVCMLDCGEVLTEVEPGCETSLNVLSHLAPETIHNHRRLLH